MFLLSITLHLGGYDRLRYFTLALPRRVGLLSDHPLGNSCSLGRFPLYFDYL